MKVLLLHASAGAGHKRAAEALAKAFQAADGSAEIKVVDILDFTPPLFRKTYARGYLDLVRRAPELWGYLYAEADRKADEPWRKHVRTLFNKINAASFYKFYREFDPDVAVCTHFMPLQMLSERRGRGRGRAPVFCAVTDFAVHALWILEHVDCYYVAMEEAKRHLMRREIPPDRVVVTGIPVDPVFAAGQKKQEAARALGLDPALPVVLLLSGGCGVGPAAGLIRSFGREEPVCQLLVIAGANEKLREQAEEAAREVRTPVRVYGFVNNIHVMMDACDLVISKPGGLTTSEVLAKGRPLLIIDPIPGQEQRNGEVVLEAGAAARLFEVDDAYCKVRDLLADKSRLARMAREALAVGRPRAAEGIVRDILKRMRSGKPV